MLDDLLNGLDLKGNPGFCIGLLAGGNKPEFSFHGQCVEGGRPVDVDTLWEAASLSKPVVALLAIECSAQDPGWLTRPLVTSAAEFGAADDNRWSEITLWNALTHTTGLPNWRPAGDPLSFESDPGSPGYSGEGYELLLAELSARSGLSADVLLDRHLKRLRMAESTFTPSSDGRPNVAVGHTSSGQTVPRAQVGPPRASGSLQTTAVDYMRFLAMVARADAIDDPVIHSAANGMAERSVEILPGHGRTLGWAFTQTATGDVLWQHGDNPGFKHIAAVRPATGEAVLVFTNSDEGQTLYRSVCERVLQVEVW